MGGRELLVSCSDDFTMFLWDAAGPAPGTDAAAAAADAGANTYGGKKPLARLVGHQAPVNHISFSPDGRYVASAGCVEEVGFGGLGWVGGAAVLLVDWWCVRALTRSLSLLIAPPTSPPSPPPPPQI